MAQVFNIVTKGVDNMTAERDQINVRNESDGLGRGTIPVQRIGRWVRLCGGYFRENADGTIDTFKTRAMGHSLTFEVMPEGFEPSSAADLPVVLDPERASCSR